MKSAFLLRAAERKLVDHGKTFERTLLHLLMYEAWMLHYDGRTAVAAAADRDAVAFLESIVRGRRREVELEQLPVDCLEHAAGGIERGDRAKHRRPEAAVRLGINY